MSGSLDATTGGQIGSLILSMIWPSLSLLLICILSIDISTIASNLDILYTVSPTYLTFEDKDFALLSFFSPARNSEFCSNSELCLKLCFADNFLNSILEDGELTRLWFLTVRCCSALKSNILPF